MLDINERVQPIKPEEIQAKKIATIPNAILQAVNELIALKWNGHSAKVERREIVERYSKITGAADNRATMENLFFAHAFEFESAYQNEGWYVVYNKPGVGDSDFEPYYFFEIRK